VQDKELIDKCLLVIAKLVARGLEPTLDNIQGTIEELDTDVTALDVKFLFIELEK
jgi:hypothetical protein